MQEPLVSVLMTCYNREKYIGQAIESVLASDYRNLELIIVDDVSKDGTLAIAKTYAAKDSRVHVYLNEKNLGDYPNRNKAADYAKGKYLKYVDSDDYIYPWGLSALVRMMEGFPEAGWGLCSLLQIPQRPYPFLLQPQEAYEYHYCGPGLFHKAPLSSIIKKEAFSEAGGFSGSRMVGDFEMWHRMALRYPVVLMPDGMVWYREHAGQEVSSYRRYILEYEKIRLKYLNHPDNPISREKAREIIDGRKRFLVRRILYDMLFFQWIGAANNFKIRLFYRNK